MRVLVKRFQSIAKAALTVEGLTVVVGPSDLGKSALVRAISGALFNRPGDSFVRVGASTTSVDLIDAPGRQGPLQISWRKGRGTNEFEINGKTYEKVGQGTPDVLVAAGFRDVTVGDDELRPQMATQFDRLFLVDRSGPFISEVLTMLSRLSVLTLADKLCSTDVAKDKQTLHLRKADLLRVETQVTALAEAKALGPRVLALASALQGITRLAERLTALERLQPVRQQLQRATAIVLPEAVNPQPLWTRGQRLLQLLTLVQAHRRASVVTSLAFPPRPLGIASIEADYTRVTRVIPLIQEHRRLRAIGAAGLPPVTPATFDTWQTSLGRAQTVAATLTVYHRARVLVEETDQAVANAQAAEVSAAAAYTTLKQDAKVCPVCERPFDGPPS